MSILVIAEHDQQRLNPATARCVAAALQIDADIHLLVAGCDCAEAARQAAQLVGVSAVQVVDAPHYASPTAENLAALIVQSVQSVSRASPERAYSHLIAPATAFGKNLMPRVAALLDVAPITEVCAIASADTFVRPIYAGNALATVCSHDSIKVMTVRPSAFPAVEHRPSGAAPVHALAAGPDCLASQVVERHIDTSARPDLGAARVVVAGGRGLVSATHFEALLLPLADCLHAAIGASRAAVDAGFVGNDHQIGQTGKVVAPDLYLAIGISGATQHIAGMRDSRVIVAINKDAEAPIFQVADYGLVGDLFTLVPELTERLGQADDRR